MDVVASAVDAVVSALAAALAGAVRLIVSAARLVEDRLLAPAVRAARAVLLVFVAVIVVTARAARRVLGSLLASIRPPIVAAARALTAAISNATRSIRRSLSDAQGASPRQRWRVPPMASGLRSAVPATACNELLGHRPDQTRSGHRRIRP